MKNRVFANIIDSIIGIIIIIILKISVSDVSKPAIV